MGEEDTTRRTWSELLSEASRAALVFGGAAYAAGLMISNIYLGLWGISADTLAEPRYVLVGTLWLFLLSVATALAGLMKHSIAEAQSAIRERRLFRAVMELLSWAGTPVLVVFIFWLLTGLKVPPPWGLMVYGAIILLFGVGAIGVVVENSVDLAAWLRQRQSRRPVAAFAYSYLVLGHVVWVVVTLALYAILVYPFFLRPIGGGQSVSANFLPLDRSVMPPVLSKQQQPDGSFGPLEIVHEDGESYYVFVGSGLGKTVARIRKGDIRVVIMTPVFERRR